MTLSELADHLESYDFNCEGGPLKNCVDWIKIKNHLRACAEVQIVGDCRNGAPHYCPNCDNSFTALRACADALAPSKEKHEETKSDTPKEAADQRDVQDDAAPRTTEARRADEGSGGSMGTVLVAGERMERPIYAFVLACDHLLADEQAKPNPDNALIAVLCDAVRLTRELEAMAKEPLRAEALAPHSSEVQETEEDTRGDGERLSDGQDLPRKSPYAGSEQKLPLCGREDHGPACALCEVLEHNQERAWAKGQCGSLSPDYLKLVCGRESGHAGQHRGYVDEHDDCLFWGKNA